MKKLLLLCCLCVSCNDFNPHYGCFVVKEMEAHTRSRMRYQLTPIQGRGNMYLYASPNQYLIGDTVCLEGLSVQKK